MGGHPRKSFHGLLFPPPPGGGGYRYFQTLSIAARSSALFRSVQLPFSPVSFYLASFFPPSLFESLCSSAGRGTRREGRGWGHLSLTISCRYGAMDGWKDLRNIRGIPFLFFVPLILQEFKERKIVFVQFTNSFIEDDYFNHYRISIFNKLKIMSFHRT